MEVRVFGSRADPVLVGLVGAGIQRGDAAALGAVDTVVFEDGMACGYNTDAPGFRLSVRRSFADAPREGVVPLGAGGAGRRSLTPC
jgi:shikimate 5-dehydrogenase